MAKNTKPVARTRAIDKGARAGDGALDAAADSQQRLLDAQASIEREAARTRELETRYRYLLSASSDAVLMVDAEKRRITDANPAAAERLGTAISSLQGAPVR